MRRRARPAWIVMIVSCRSVLAARVTRTTVAAAVPLRRRATPATVPALAVRAGPLVACSVDELLDVPRLVDSRRRRLQRLVLAPLGVPPRKVAIVPFTASHVLSLAMSHRAASLYVDAASPSRLWAGEWRAKCAPEERPGRGARSGTPEDEVHGAQDAQPRPQIVQLDRLAHVEEREGDEDGEGDGLLEDLEQVLEEGDRPAHEGGDVPLPVGEVPEVGVPGEGHEDVGRGQQQGGAEE